MFRNNIWYAISLAELHGCIASPFTTMSMDDIRLTVFSNILIKHFFYDADPALRIQPETLWNATHIRLIDCHIVQHLIMVTVRELYKFTQALLYRKLHIADNRHTMT